MPVPMQTPYGPVDALADWLRANDVEPGDVPMDSSITIERETIDGAWCIRYVALVRNEAGRIYLDGDTGRPAEEERTAILNVDPPENIQVRRI